MSNGFDDWLTEHSRRLKYEPEDPFLLTRLQARIEERVWRPATVYDILFRWRRVVGVALTALGLATALSLWSISDSYTPASLEAVANAELLNEDFYRAAQ